MKRFGYFAILGAFLLHVYFYISSFSTRTLDYFFAWGNIHNWQGIDFYQVPNGAFAFFHGGKLTGEITNGVTYSFGNTNVYHPLFTLLFGTPLQLVAPDRPFIIFAIVKFFITVFIAYLIYKRFKDNKHIVFALILYFAVFPQYLEIWNGQYHFFLTTMLFLILWDYLSHTNTIRIGFFYFFTLLVKPIGLVWIPFLFIKKQWKVLITGLVLFLISTIPFVLTQTGTYYITNIIDRIQNPIGGPPGIFTIDALFRYYSVPKETIMIIRYSIFALLLFLEIRYKPAMFFSFFLWTSYYLLFYDLVFEYHYTTVVPFFVLGVLTQKIFQTKKAKILMASFLLPTPFFLLHYFQFHANGHNVTDTGWVILVLFRVIPLLLLCFLSILFLIQQKKTSTLQK